MTIRFARLRPLLLVLIGALVVCACNPQWPNIDIDFPGDPRVLHGSWWIIGVHDTDLDVLPAAMELVAGALNGQGTGYQLSGELTLGDRTLRIEGSVDAPVHRYREAIGPSAPPPPPVVASLRLLDADLNEVYLVDATMPPYVDWAEYQGTLRSVAEDIEYQVMLSRDAPDAD